MYEFFRNFINILNTISNLIFTTKYYKLLCILCISFGIFLKLIINNTACAAINIDIKTTANLYFGLGIGYNKYLVSNEFKNVINNNQGKCNSSSLNLLTPIIGMQFHDRYGIEIGYGIYNDLQFSGSKPGNLEIRNYFIDITGLIPAPSFLGADLDLIGGIGIGNMHLRENGVLQAMGNGSSYNKFGFRFKAGMLYPLDQNWNIRGTLSYQGIGSKDSKYSINSVRSFNIDLLYTL